MNNPSPFTARGGTARQSFGKFYRRPASGAERVRRDAFGKQWGAFAKQASADLRRERV